MIWVISTNARKVKNMQKQHEQHLFDEKNCKTCNILKYFKKCKLTVFYLNI